MPRCAVTHPPLNLTVSVWKNRVAWKVPSYRIAPVGVRRLRLDLGNSDHADADLRWCLAHDHLAGGDEAVGQEVHDVLPPARPVASKLLPVELVPDDKVASSTPLEVALLEARVGSYHLGLVLQVGAQKETVVVVGGELRFRRRPTALGGRRGWGWERHDVSCIARVLPGGKLVERC